MKLIRGIDLSSLKHHIVYWVGVVGLIETIHI